MTRSSFLCLLLCIFFGCNNSPNNKATNSESTPTKTPEVTSSQILPYPTLPNNVAQDLYNRCDFVDYIFYDPSLPMSISLNEQSSIRTTFSHFSREPAKTNETCKPTGRVMFQSQGEYIIEADFYIVNGCQYYVFMVDGKPTYANAMSPDGIAFFTNNITQAKKSVQQKLQGQ